MLKNSYRDKKDVCGLISLWTSLGVKLFDLSAFFVHLFMLISFFVSIYMLLASRDAIEGPGGRDVSIGATDASSRFSRLFYCFIHDRHLNNELKAQTTTLLCVYHNLRIWRYIQEKKSQREVLSWASIWYYQPSHKFWKWWSLPKYIRYESTRYQNINQLEV